MTRSSGPPNGRLLLAALLLLGCAGAATAAEPQAVPVKAWIESNPAYQAFAYDDIRIGDVWVAYPDGTKERLTRDGIASAPAVSTRGAVAWTLCEPDATSGTLCNYRGQAYQQQLRIWRGGREIATAKAEKVFIEAWRFEPDGGHFVVQSRQAHGPSVIERFETASGKRVGRATGFDDPRPEWADGFDE